METVNLNALRWSECSSTISGATCILGRDCYRSQLKLPDDATIVQPSADNNRADISNISI